MPAQKTKSSVLGKFKGALAKSFKAHKDDPVTMGNMDLPGGIKGGVAQIVDVRFGEYKSGANAGKPYFYAAAIVKSPRKHGDITIEGLRTSIMEPLCDTPGKYRESFDEHYAWVQNELKKIGGEDCLEGIDENNADSALEELAASLKEAAPHIRFETSEGKPSIDPRTKKPRPPMVFHNWFGACESPGEDEEADVVDETGKEPQDDDEAIEANQADAATGGDEFDAEALRVAADGGDEDACAAILAKAAELGIEQEVTDAADWATGAGLIVEKLAEGGDGEAEAKEETPPAIPAKGENYKYQPIDLKTKKPAVNPKTKKPILVEVEVTAVDKKAGTVTLKNNDDNKTVYKAVPFDELVSPD